MPGTTKRKSANDRPLVEWIVGGIACVAIAGLVGFLVFQALTGDSRPPRLSVTVEAVERGESGAVVRVAVRNHGDRAAAGVTVHAADGGAERSIEFDYVAGHAVRRGAFVFPDADIVPDRLAVGIGGFVEP
ncbi:MAG: hypothetical protein M9895_16770 [Aquamicrobium sp.]|uniref:hypothetical protein n=1 Tax=Aquamicrobium sp. TaxID=1872579 RepID=UPI00349EDEC3|nr:hypothetical protein [Aquamicrobium sp.]